MRFILHSNFNAASVRDNLGKPAYSYYFVLKTFLPVFEQLGTVTLVERPEEEVDPIYEASTAQGEACIFVSVSPPNATPLNLKCPTIVLFAWEFSTLPDGAWANAAPSDDWRYVFDRLGAAISLSHHTATVVKRAMGPDFPVFAIATPIWDRRRHLAALPAPIIDDWVQTRGEIIDTRDYALSPELTCSPGFPPPPVETPALTVQVETPALTVQEEPPEPAEVTPDGEPESPTATDPSLMEATSEIPTAPQHRGVRHRLAITKRYIMQWYEEAVRDLLPHFVASSIAVIGESVVAVYRRLSGWQPPPPPPPPPPLPPPPPPPPPSPPSPPPPLLRVALRGIVYTSMFNPTDGRKNWHDIVTAFCWTLREVEDATLVLKLVRGAAQDHRRELFTLLSQLAPYKCRVVTMDGFLEDADYDALIAASSFYVNASSAEGLCMPLMEFMSAGRPAIAPRHTAMADYVDDGSAFIVASSPEHNVWPDDPRRHYTTMRERIHWDTLSAAFADSYRVATQDPTRYAEMGRNAAETMRLYCSDAVVREKLRVAMDAALDAAQKRTAAQAELERIAAEEATAPEAETA